MTAAGMRILVAVKRVPDPNQRVRVKPDGTGIDPAGLRWVINPGDEVALEQAVRWQESGAAIEIIAASVGGPGCKDVLRVALALGAIHVAATDDVVPLTIATALAAVARDEHCDLALLGALAVDDGTSETGPMLAALLDWPQATRILAASATGATIQVERVSDNGVEAAEIALPCVLTADLRLATPRFANLGAVLRAKQQPIEERSIAAPEVAPSVASMTAVTRTRAARHVASARELVAALRTLGAL